MYEHLRRAALEIAQEAGVLALEMRKNLGNIHNKGDKDVVTEADFACDELIRQRIHEKFPDHNVVTEESQEVQKGSDFTWHVDPIDGTVNFARGIPLWCVSIGVLHEKNLAAGAVVLPALGEVFSAAFGSGAFLNQEKINVSAIREMERAAISQGDVNVGRNPEHLKQCNTRNENLRKLGEQKLQRIKCLGSAAIELCWTAAGRLEAYYMAYFNSWDVAAGALILLEAGGKISQWNGEAWDLTSETGLYSNGYLHPQMVDLGKRC